MSVANTRTIVVLTALDLEYQAVHEHLVDARLHRHPQGTRFEVGRLAGGRCRVALAHVGVGNQSAAVLAERAIAEFAPAALLFVGVAGGLHRHIALGDVVVGTHVYAFHGATSEGEGLWGRPRTWPLSHRAEQIARHLFRTRSWARPPVEADSLPQVHFGPIAAGEVVLNSTVSALARWLHDHYNDALAIEMEGAGASQAGLLNSSLPVIVIRGVSDHADGTKESTDRHLWQQRAVANAASFAVALAEELAVDIGKADAAETRIGRRSTMQVPNQNIRNTASGNAQVGVQAGAIHGGVTIGATGERVPADLPAALVGFRTDLQNARSAGTVDEDTYEAAAAELAAADEALQTDSPANRRALLVALKKVRGLIGDVADLTTKIGVAIAIAQGLS
ncbi:5'-methylthioadenosine/S-adenosylhomocysteine nucleosidase family protein [Parafrankia elaeagni]|uniref:5'-methylthioadenosine/S-adenosylhomocysteine nucleosidase family protein n=1 Tax=Parafrankia elaeagni TaxID=222534 RepID=UPI000373381D|nr:5'-methylthioadenosine/S-adenosylhomocysteine nucleosidase [Parafrankia elaeagni]